MEILFEFVEMVNKVNRLIKEAYKVDNYSINKNKFIYFKWLNIQEITENSIDLILFEINDIGKTKTILLNLKNEVETLFKSIDREKLDEDFVSVYNNFDLSVVKVIDTLVLRMSGLKIDIDSKENIIEKNDDSKFEISSISQKVYLMYRLGILDFLQSEFPILKGKSTDISNILYKIIDKGHKDSTRRVVNALIQKNKEDKNYPNDSQEIDFILSKLNENN